VCEKGKYKGLCEDRRPCLNLMFMEVARAALAFCFWDHQANSRNLHHAGSKSMRTSPLESTELVQPVSMKPVDDDQKSFVLQVALKCADLGHLSAPRSVHRT